MKILIACEINGKLRDNFLSLGHDTFSCDIKPSSHPNHIQDDIRNIIKPNTWDMMIAHPPCTYLSNAGVGAFSKDRYRKTEEAIELFKLLYFAPIFHICIENPLGYMNRSFKKENQVIHPYYFGDSFMKRTCLWLRNLPLLKSTNKLEKPKPAGVFKSGPKKGKVYHWTDGIGGKNRSDIRSVTFDGIANAMKEQWGNLNHYTPINAFDGSPIKYNYIGEINA